MKTQNLLLTAGLIVGAYYLFNKNSKSKNDNDSSGGGGGGGAAFPLGYYPVIPAISNPTTGPIEVVVTPIPRPFANPKPYGTKSEPRNISQVEATDIPSTSNSNTTTGGTTTAPHGPGYTTASSAAASQP